MTNYLVTTAQACATPHKGMVQAMENYARRHNAKIIILPTFGKHGQEDWTIIHPDLKKFTVLYEDLALNKNLYLRQFNVRPQAIDPSTGLERFVQQDQSAIFASPKQRLRFIPHSNHKMPKALMTTGAVTHPRYASGEDTAMERRRLGGIAKRDHIYGFVVVSILSSTRYLFRHVRVSHRGHFSDMGITYMPDGSIVHAEVDAFVAGDWHAGNQDRSAVKSTLQQIEFFNPNSLILHDFFDGYSINPHSPKEWITGHIAPYTEESSHSLEQECLLCVRELQMLAKAMKGKPIYLVDSNHHDFLKRWLNAGLFMKDAQNARIGIEMARAFLHGQDPWKTGMEYALAHTGKKTEAAEGIPSNVVFLDPDEGLRMWGWELANHGHKGSGGSRPNINQIERSFGKSFTAHSHTAQMLRNALVVGTQQPLKVPYMKGSPSNWTHTNGVLYKYGQPQLITSIDGKWADRANLDRASLDAKTETTDQSIS